MLGNIVRRIMYGEASKIDFSEVNALVRNLDNVDFQKRESNCNCAVSETSRSEGRDSIVELNIQLRQYQERLITMYSVLGKTVLDHLPDDNGLMVGHLEYRSRSNGRTTQHHLWIERIESDPVINPRYETYKISGISRDVALRQEDKALISAEPLEGHS